MSGPPSKGKKRDTAPTPPGEPFVPVKPAPVITIENEVRPPPPNRNVVPTITYCKDCFWGQDVSLGFRHCRGRTPDSLYRNVTGYAGAIFAVAMWSKVEDNDYCAVGTPK